MMGGRPLTKCCLGTYRRPERRKRLESSRRKVTTTRFQTSRPFLPVLPMSFDPPAASMPDPSPSFDPGADSSSG